MAGQETQSGISVHYLESIARVAPNMTVADLVAMLHENDAADAREGTTSNTEASGMTKASVTSASQALQVSSTAADSSAVSVQGAPSTGHPPTDMPETEIQGDSRPVSQEGSSTEANDIPAVSATQYLDQPSDSSRQENTNSTQVLQSTTATTQPAFDDEDGGIELHAAGTPNAPDQTQSLPSTVSQSFATDSDATTGPVGNSLTAASSTDGAASLTQSLPAPVSAIPNATAGSTAGSSLQRPSGAPEMHHSSLEAYGDVSGDDLLQSNNGIGIHELFGARMLLIAATGKSYTEIFKILNNKLNVQGRKLKSSKVIDHRVANALRHIFHAFDDPTYQARKQDLSDAQNDPIRRQAYSQMLKNPATYTINPRAQCGECKNGKGPQQTGMPASQQSSPVLPAAGQLYHPFPALPSSSSATNDGAVDPSWSQFPQVPTPPVARVPRQKRKAKTSTDTAATNTISSVPAQSGRVKKAPSRKRAAAAAQLQMGEDASKKWQGEPETRYPQAQSAYGYSFIQDATASSQPAYPQAQFAHGYSFIQAAQSTYQNDTTGLSNIPAFPADEAHHMAHPAQVDAQHSDATPHYGSTTQQNAYFPSSPPLMPYTPRDNVQSFDSEAGFALNEFNNAPNSDMGFATSQFDGLSNVDLSGLTSDALNDFDQDRFFFSEANPTFGADLSAFFPQHNEPSSALEQYYLPADAQANTPSSALGQYDASAGDQGNDGGAQDSSEHDHEQSR
ncbi:hypothetical protein CKM354_000024800 [Cercospora kikuchii]|uniref:Uncharacterized protein n=1 Tax=Cercospora kikuchii TaxID=84275 RepID=A0A9P3F721_9PEZI|nr:uncharacterized protein CKM354_000024800 [Cercospora kikuchii]GIZ36781.1 hypothetical protein CKM354_000024800 [Cercospora kikuchii]